MSDLSVDVYADIACPWCYVGRARLNRALDHRPDLSVHRRWRPFRLQPAMPAEGRDFRSVLESKFGSWDRVRRMFDRVQEIGAEEGLTFDFEAIDVVPNTADAHRLVLWAQDEREAGDALAARLFQAYFTEGRNVSHADVLADCACDVGATEADARDLLSTDRYAADVRASQHQAQRSGVSGVPCYVFDGDTVMTGAQPADAFLNVFEAVQGDSSA